MNIEETYGQKTENETEGNLLNVLTTQGAAKIDDEINKDQGSFCSL
jgi:hypothetical protein